MTHFLTSNACETQSKFRKIEMIHFRKERKQIDPT
jgi:hypothetical protein